MEETTPFKDLSWWKGKTATRQVAIAHLLSPADTLSKVDIVTADNCDRLAAAAADLPIMSVLDVPLSTSDIQAVACVQLIRQFWNLIP